MERQHLSDESRINIQKEGETFAVVFPGGLTVGGFTTLGDASVFVLEWLARMSRASLADKTRRDYLGAALLSVKTEPKDPS